jgi:hypothetical protein
LGKHLPTRRPGIIKINKEMETTIEIEDPSVMEECNENEDEDSSSSEENDPSSSTPSSPVLTNPHTKRAASVQPLGEIEFNKRLCVGPEKRALEAKLFRGKAVNLRDFETYISPDDSHVNATNAKSDVKVPDEEIQKLLESIPLEDQDQEAADIHKTLVVRAPLVFCG